MVRGHWVLDSYFHMQDQNFCKKAGSRPATLQHWTQMGS